MCKGTKESLVERSGDQNPFQGIDVGWYAAPQAVDWDNDGDLDLLVGGVNGQVYFFERLEDGSLALRSGDQNPFQGIDVGAHSSPQAVDWDNDGDLDLLVGHSYGLVYFFERLGNGSLAERSGAESPFQGIDVNLGSTPQAVDWDNDGDLDLIVGARGYVNFFERLENVSLALVSGFLNLFEFAGGETIAYGLYSRPQAVDWDNDGDLDLLVGNSFGVDFFERLADGSLTQRSGDQNPFQGIVLDSSWWRSMPQAVDWDNDGDLDLLVGGVNGQVYFFERLRDESLAERSDAQSPFQGIDVGSYASPQAVDWDNDGDLDLLLAEYWSVKFFERLEDGSLSERSGAESPFRDIDGDLDGDYKFRSPRPQAVDWDDDGDLDLLVGEGALVYFFERLENGSMARRSGDQSPFQGIDVGDHAAPHAVDWDDDGDLDLLVGHSYGRVLFFERLEDGSLAERSGAESPFQGIDVGSHSIPQAVDWDNDGDLDLFVGENALDFTVVGEETYGQLYFERLEDGSLAERSGAQSPLQGIDLEINSRLHVADWDNDGVLDFLVGTASGRVRYFTRGCIPSSACSNKGVCLGKSDTCSCLPGYNGTDCSACSTGYYCTSNCQPVNFDSSSRQCSPCAAPSGNTLACGGRGICWDDSEAQRLAALSGEQARVAAKGNGSCLCSTWFAEVDIEGRQTCGGECPQGHYEKNDDSMEVAQCPFLSCPEGGECTDDGVVAAQAHYWLPAGGDAVPVQCPLGGYDASCSGHNECAQGYAGAMCAVCQDGYGRLGLNCVPCTGSELTLAVGLPLFIITTAAFPCLLHFCSLASLAQPLLRRYGPKNQGADYRGIDVFDHVAKAVKTQGKILLLFLQAATGWTWTLYTTFPSILSSEWDVFHSIVNDVTSLFSFSSDLYVFRGRSGCTLSPPAYFAMMLCVVPTFLVIYLIFDQAFRLILPRKYLPNWDLLMQGFWHQLMLQASGPYFWLTYMAYTPLTGIIVARLPLMGASFDCTLEEYGEDCFLRLDYSVTATSDMYKSYIMPMAVISFVIFPIGIPLSYFCVLRRAVKKVGEWKQYKSEKAAIPEAELELQWNNAVKKEAGDSWHSFYGQYKPSYWWFECVNMYRQCALASVAFISADGGAAYILWSLVIACCHAAAVSTFKPYDEAAANHAQLIASLSLVLMFSSQLTALTYTHPDGVNPGQNQLEMFLIVSANVVVFAILFVYVTVQIVPPDKRDFLVQRAKDTKDFLMTAPGVIWRRRVRATKVQVQDIGAIVKPAPVAWGPTEGSDDDDEGKEATPQARRPQEAAAPTPEVQDIEDM